jgi:lysozyme
MQTSQAGIDLIKQFEALRLEAYLCPAECWTIGWGHTADVCAGMRITEGRAEELLRDDVRQVESGLPSVIRVPLTQGQHDALMSLCFNLRGGALRLPKIAPRLVARINSGDSAGAASELLDINRANGVVLPGLTRRREAERALFVAAPSENPVTAS